MTARPYVIVVGGGKVGFYLTKHLIDRNYEVTLIEKNAERATWIEHQLGTVTVMVGDGDEMAFLGTTGIERAEVMVAATGDDEDNLVACQLAKVKFNVPRTIARVNNPVNVGVFTALGVDVPVSATDLLMDLIEAQLSPQPSTNPNVASARDHLVDVMVSARSSHSGKRVDELQLPEGDTVVCLVRDGKPILASPELVVEPDDEVIVYSADADTKSVEAALAG